jgi:rhodanese-related sulfurtransferase/biotin operon repressor
MQFPSDRDLKDNLYEQFARICKALGSARRFELLDLLSNGEQSVEKLAQETSMTVANTSQHLQLLRASRLVQIRRKGVGIFYRLADPTVFNLVQAVQDLAKVRLAEVDRIVDELVLERKELNIFSSDDLAGNGTKEKYLILDVRPGSEYAYTHIPGAVSIPLITLAEQMEKLPKDKEIVVYCRDYYSRLSDHAVRLLLTNGFKASRLDGGMSEWKSQGKPVHSLD